MIFGINYQLINEYGIFSEDEGLIGIREDAPKNAKEEYEKLKEIIDRETAACGHC